MSSSFLGADIIGEYSLNSAVQASYLPTTNSVFSIVFDTIRSGIVNYKSAKFCVMTAENIKIFVGQYIDKNNVVSTPVQIPLIGQTLQSFVDHLNQIPGIIATVKGSDYEISADSLIETAFTEALDLRVFFEKKNTKSASDANLLRENVILFYTTVEPFSAQNNYSQSFGGYVSTNTINSGFLLKRALGIYSNNLEIEQASLTSNLSLVELQKNEYLQINDEIIKIDRWDGLVAFIQERNAYQTPLRCHAINSLVKPIRKNEFLDKNLGSYKKQYRCLGLKNIDAVNIAKDLFIYSSIENRNVFSEIKIAIEVPKSEFFSGVSSSTGTVAFSVNALVNKQTNDYYKNAPLRFTSGANINQVRIIKSYIPSTGTLELFDRLPYSVALNDTFVIDPQPSSRMKSVFDMPIGENISDFYSIGDYDNGLSINVKNNRKNKKDLFPNEVVYIWIERSISEINDEYTNNRISLSMQYSRV